MASIRAGKDIFEPRNAYPVYLGDVLHDRYQVFRKLGYGSECTVWLARDKRVPTRHFVAVKAYSSDAEDTVFTVDEILQSSPGSLRGKPYIERSVDSISVQGPNGRHVCRVVEPLGRSLHSIIWDRIKRRCDLNKPKPWLGKAVEGDGWSARTAKTICRQILLGLDYLHSRRIAHRDIHPRNVCAALQFDVSSLDENEIQAAIWHSKQEEARPRDQTHPATPQSDSSDSDTDSVKLERQIRIEKVKEQQLKARRIIEKQWQALELDPSDKLAEPHSTAWNTANFLNYRNQSHIELIRQRDGAPLDDTPLKRTDIHYTVAPEPLEDGLDLGKDFRFVLGDLGFACAFEECEKQPALGGVANFMSPEHALGLPTTSKGDIYSLGLLFWKVVMLSNLAEQHVSFKPDADYPRNRRIRDLAQRLGPMPSALRARWGEADEFLDADGNALDKFMEWDWQEYEPDEFEYGDMWYQARIRRPLDMSDGDLGAFVVLIKNMLQWTPESRPSTSEILSYQWFKDSK